MPTTRTLLLRSRHFHTLLLFFVMLLVAMLLSHASWPSQRASAAPNTGVGGASAPQAPGGAARVP